jgi:hypothetical protein
MGAFGLLDDYHHVRVPRDLIVEANPRIDIWQKGADRPVREGNLCLNGTLLTVTSDRPMPGVMRLWWACPTCGQRCRYLYLRDTIACMRCHKLQHASRHWRRQTPALAGIGRVERLRKKLGNCELRPFAPLLPCRHGPHRVYYERLTTQILDEEEKLLAHLGGIVRDLKRRVRKSKGPP